MAHYRRSELDLSTITELVLAMLNPTRKRGEVSARAKEYGVSRQYLYELRDRGKRAIEEALVTQRPEPKATGAFIEINDEFVRKVIVCLSVLPPSIRNLQTILEVLFGQHRSVGYIQNTLKVAGERARQENQGLHPERAVLGELDEIYENHQPCLSVVDGRSLLALNLEKQTDCDATTWGVTLLNLTQQGVRFQDVASDSAQGIHSGVHEAHLDVPERCDLFHLFQEAHHIARFLENTAYRALRTLYRARQEEQKAQMPKRAGRPLKKSHLTTQEADLLAHQAAWTSDFWDEIFANLRRVLQPFDPSGAPIALDQIHAAFLSLLEYMQLFTQERVVTFTKRLTALVDTLLAPIQNLFQNLPPQYWRLPRSLQAFLYWAWQHRQQLHLDFQRDFPLALQPIACSFWSAMSDFHRSSSLVECIHSWLRPFFVLHRGTPDWLLPLLQAFWNHHSFQRGFRAGFSPLQLANCDNIYSPSEFLSRLSTPRNIPDFL